MQTCVFYMKHTVTHWIGRFFYAPILASGDRSWQLRRLTAPALIIHGTADPLLPLAAGRETAELIPGSRLVEVEGMGHQLPEALVPKLGMLIAQHCHRHPA